MTSRIIYRAVFGGMTAALMAAVLAGCAGSPPAVFHTLLLPDPGQDAAARATEAPYLLEVLPVDVPVQADQPQIMLRDGQGAVTPRYSDRWTAPIGDEIRAALSDTLTRTLGAADVRGLRPAAGTPVWRVQVDVQRFDATVGEAALLDATWRVRPVDTPGAALLCRSVVRAVLSGPGVRAAVEGQQEAVAALARTIASAIQSQGRTARPATEEVRVSNCRSATAAEGARNYADGASG